MACSCYLLLMNHQHPQLHIIYSIQNIKETIRNTKTIFTILQASLPLQTLSLNLAKMQFTSTLITITSAVLAGLSTAAPANSAGDFVPGRCGIHVTQWQKNENGVGADYQFDVVVNDGVGNGVGGVSRLAVPDFETRSFTSGLNGDISITAGAVDADSVKFVYEGFTFSSANGCATGGYEDGNREMDCGFAC